jgi:hypothetical protein
MEPKDIHQLIADVTSGNAKLLSRELGIELETFGAGLAHVAIMKRQFEGMKKDYAELIKVYEVTEKQFQKLAQDYECLALDAKDRHMGSDWK